MLKPSFSLTLGSLEAGTDRPVGGPQAFDVARDMDVPADGLRVLLAEREGVALGDAVRLAVGHDGDDEVVFTGTVVGLRPRLSGLLVFALGAMGALLDLRTAATYEDRTAGGIARDVIEQAGLDVDRVDDGPELPRFAVDRRVSAFVHLKGLADRLGFELYATRTGGVRFHALGDAAGLDAFGGLGGALSGLAGGEGYRYGRHLLAGRTRRHPPAWGRVDVGGESPMSSQGARTSYWLTVNDADFRGSAGSEAPAVLVLDPAARTKDLADRFAAGRLAVARRTAHEVEVTVLGRPTVELGDTLSVGDVPEALFNTDGYVRAVRHRFGPAAGFVTDFRIAASVPS